MIKELLQRAFSSDTRKRNLEEQQMKELRESACTASAENEAVIEASSEQHPDSPYASDLSALEERYGELKPGMTIEITLHEALELMPRKRHRSDAYKGVRSQLNRMGIKFSIVNPAQIGKDNENIRS